MFEMQLQGTEAGMGAGMGVGVGTGMGAGTEVGAGMGAGTIGAWQDQPWYTIQVNMH
jgi:hypothetical protein